MRLLLSDKHLTVERADGDPRAKDDSHFFFLLRQRLNHNPLGLANGQGFQTGRERWIKREMWRDGHLVSEGAYYLRERRERLVTEGAESGIARERLAFHDPHYAIRSAAAAFNAGEPVHLDVADLAG